METNQKISFVIVNYKSKEYLEKCVSAILESTKNIKKEITVVNINDTLILSDNIKLINISENKGFGSACNLGAKTASGDILCFLNPDTEIISDDFEKIIYEFEKNSEIGIIGPRLVDEKNKVQKWTAGKEINLSDIILNNLGSERSKKIWESKENIGCAWVSGACMFIKKESFEKLSGFDENFFMYFEDVDLCKRARNLGYKILYYPEFIIKHFGGKSFENRKEQKELYYKSQDYYFQKHFGKIRTNLLKLIRMITIN